MKNPLKLNFKTEIFPIAIIMISAIAAAYFYRHFPDLVASHWNFKGEVDSYSSKTAGTLMVPGMLAALYLLFTFIPFLDPKVSRYSEFRSAYLQIRNAILLFMLMIYFALGAVNLGLKTDIGTIVPVLVGALFIFMGNLMGKIKSNWYVGLRNPWTLSDSDVWNKANRFSGKTFIISGILIAAEAFVPDNMKLAVFIAAIAIAVVGPTVYSFILYNRNKK